MFSPGSLSSPVERKGQQHIDFHAFRRVHTPIEFLIDHILDHALVLHRDALRLERRAADVAVGVHGLLERIVLPPEHVIGVVGVARLVTAGPDEGLAAVCGPVGLVVELGGVPDCLEHELGDLDGVSGWAGTAGLKGAGLGVCDVGSVVGGVEVLAVPAAVGEWCK